MGIKRYVVAISGASGVAYGLAFLHELLYQGHEVHLVVTEAGWRVLKEEEAWEINRREDAFYERYGELPGKLIVYPIRDVGAVIASGSFLCDGMIVIPCSMGTIARLAAGLSSNLLERAADVMLKEGYPLLLVPRETPFSSLHLENMLKLSRLGVRIIPAMPAFYHYPDRIEDMVRFVAGKVLDQLKLTHGMYKRWDGGKR